jgi:hypothetical protein
MLTPLAKELDSLEVKMVEGMPLLTWLTEV